MYMIAIEGIDGAGKSTVAVALKDHLEKTKKSRKILLTQEPFTEEIISLIAKTSWSDPVTLALLFTADRAYHLNWIKSQNPDIVILDRYYYSTIAYQSALGLDENWIKCINSKFPKPDLTVLLDIEPEIALNRIKRKDLFDFDKKIKSLHKVREIYLRLADNEKNFYIINASEPLKKVLSIVTKLADSLIP